VATPELIWLKSSSSSTSTLIMSSCPTIIEGKWMVIANSWKRLVEGEGKWMVIANSWKRLVEGEGKWMVIAGFLLLLLEKLIIYS
jgi:hypothetical protein